MRILHYFLGFPPYRTGGLTKYSFDLMSAQAEHGDTVVALSPGKMLFISPKIKIVRRKDVDGIVNYELINPLPVSLDEGITDFEAYMRPGEVFIYESFLKGVRPDVIHIHTLMGLHKEFLFASQKLKIKTVFTTHDYFGLCPKVTMYKYGAACEYDHNCQDCIQCNCTALSLKKIRIMQSSMYRHIKNMTVVKQLRRHHRKEFFANAVPPELPVNKDVISMMAEKYRKLRSYYIEMLSSVDLIHFNSTVSERVYNKYFTPKDSRVVTITHKNIADHRKEITWRFTGRLRFTSLAPAKPFKGFNVLMNVLDSLWEAGKRNFELRLFGLISEVKPYMIVQREGFSYDQLVNIFAETDVLIAPSIWYETFGFTVLEAISFGVPVIVSDHVGAQDIVGKGGIIVEAGNEESLRAAVESLTPEKLADLRNEIQKDAKVKTWDKLMTENYQLYA